MVTHNDAEDLPQQPGVYLFMQGDIPLYIGKSVNLKVRVKSHIAQSKLSKKEYAIVSQAERIDYHTTMSNFDALILEARMIQKYQPKYNVLWKDDKHYLYIKITMGDTYPKLIPVRKENDGSSLYFGPFRSTRMTQKLLYELRKIVPFCTNKSIGKRGCFYSKLGYCSPCPNTIEKITDEDKKRELQKEYRSNIKKLIDILSGKTDHFSQSLNKKLKEYSDSERYEDAIKIRNKMFQFSLFLNRRSFDEHSVGVDIDIEKLNSELDEFLKTHFKTGTKEAYRVECYDISNLFGKNTTGSMVVFQDGVFEKSEYKKFALHRAGISDIHMLEEVLLRRLKHEDWMYPDLIILDGGKPQLTHLTHVFDEHDIRIPLISIAKRPDRILTSQNNYKPIHVNRNSLLFKMFQGLRDESHRFAKKYHVHLRNGNML